MAEDLRLQYDWANKFAPELVSELFRHPQVKKTIDLCHDRIKQLQEAMIKNLARQRIIGNDAGTFFITLSDVKYTITREKNGVAYSLNPRRVLVNSQAMGFKFGFGRYLGSKFVDAIGFSSDSWVRELRESGKVLETLTCCTSPYSLLVKYQERDFSRRRIDVKNSSPMLIVPGRSDSIAVRDWEARYKT
jgi:hypothetical protein